MNINFRKNGQILIKSIPIPGIKRNIQPHWNDTAGVTKLKTPHLHPLLVLNLQGALRRSWRSQPRHPLHTLWNKVVEGSQCGEDSSIIFQVLHGSGNTQKVISKTFRTTCCILAALLKRDCPEETLNARSSSLQGTKPNLLVTAGISLK